MTITKKFVNHHASNILIESEKSREFLCNIYDDTYPIQIFRGKLNFLGGGKAKDDLSPLYTSKREIYEEFSLSKNNELDETIIEISGGDYSLPKIGGMAPLEEINKVRRNILKNLIPYQDFLVFFRQIKSGPKLKVNKAIISTFYSKVPQEIFEDIRRNLNLKRSLVNDGFLKIVKINDLISGSPLTSWACGRILEYHIHKKIPNPEDTMVKPLGKPLDSYNKYLNEFDYIIF